MADSGSYARGQQPRSVPDIDEGPYAVTMQKQRMRNAQQEAEGERRRVEAIRQGKLLGDRMFSLADPEAGRRKVGHPGTLESMVPVWGSGREAMADFEDGNYLGAAVNAGLAASDIVLAKAVAGGLAKGALKTAGSHTWPQTRKWMMERGYLKAGEPGHHWAVRQKDKGVSDIVKNQPWNIKAGLDAVAHGRIDGRYTVDGKVLPRFNAVQRLWHGTPDWFKASNVSAPGHLGTAPGRAKYDDH